MALISAPEVHKCAQDPDCFYLVAELVGDLLLDEQFAPLRLALLVAVRPLVGLLQVDDLRLLEFAALHDVDVVCGLVLLEDRLEGREVAQLEVRAELLKLVLLEVQVEERDLEDEVLDLRALLLHRFLWKIELAKKLGGLGSYI